jgi:hypothetical protein
MFLGRCVDDAITLYYRRILEHGERLSPDQVKDAFWDGWKAAGEAEREQLGIAWEEEMPEDRALKLGLDAIDLSFRELVPRLGEPVAAQRKLEYVLAPGLEWLSGIADGMSVTSLTPAESRYTTRYLRCVTRAVRSSARRRRRRPKGLAATVQG